MEYLWAFLFKLYTEYFGLSLLASFGVIQAATGHSGRTYLFIFEKKIHGYIFAALTVISSLAGFFTWNWRNPTGVVEGTQQFLLFCLAFAVALVLSFLVSSVVRTTSENIKIPGIQYTAVARQTTFGAKKKG